MTAVMSEPPEAGRGVSPKWAAIADELRSHGKWALVGVQLPRSYVGHIKTARLKAFEPAGSFDAIARETRGSHADIYARYVGS